ncbi:MAG: hypothetical protein AAF771_12515 [Pseudomonadota bacterium]
MHILIALAGAALAFYFFVIRARNAADVTTELMDVANDVKLAARRFGFKRQTSVHPVDSIEEPKIAIVGIAVSFLEIGSFPTQEQRDALVVQAQSILEVSKSDAEELVVLGRWLVTECGGPNAAISRLSRKLYKLSGTSAVTPVLSLVQNTLAVNGGELNEPQRDALDDVKGALHIR